MASHANNHMDLVRVQQRLLYLAEAVDRAIISAQRALLTQDIAEAQQIIIADLLIDQLRVALEDDVHRLFAQQSALPGVLHQRTAESQHGHSAEENDPRRIAISKQVQNAPEADRPHHRVAGNFRYADRTTRRDARRGRPHC